MVRLPQYPNKKWYIGADVGGTKIATLLIDQQGVIHGQLTVPTDLTSPEHTLNSIVQAIQATLQQAQANLEDVVAVGMGVPGQVDPQTGIVNLAVNLNWHNFQAGTLLSQTLGVPCFLENDVRAAALGIYRFRNEEAVSDIAYMSIGTGISAGIILGGQLHRGVHGMAGEVGHIIVNPDGARCQCGSYGCLETFAAGPAYARLAYEAIQSGAETVLRSTSVITAKEVCQAAEDGDEVALSITKKAGQYLGLAIQGLVMSYDVKRVVLGGGLVKAGDIFTQPILAELARQRQASRLVQSMLPVDLVEAVSDDYHAGAWGAIAVAVQGAINYHRLHQSFQHTNNGLTKPVKQVKKKEEYAQS